MPRRTTGTVSNERRKLLICHPQQLRHGLGWERQRCRDRLVVEAAPAEPQRRCMSFGKLLNYALAVHGGDATTEPRDCRE